MLVAAAGGPSTYAPFPEKPEGEQRRDVDVNVWSLMNTLKAAISCCAPREEVGW